MSDEFRILSQAYKLIFYGLLLLVLASVVLVASGILLMGLLAGPGVPGVPNLMTIIMITGSLAALAGQLLMIVGKIRCFAVPPEIDGARTLIMMAVGFQLFTLLVSAISMIDDASGVEIVPNAVKGLFTLVSSLLSLASIILFLNFTGRVARFIRRLDLAASASLVIKVVIALTISFVLMIVMTIWIMGLVFLNPGIGTGGVPGGGAMMGGLFYCGISILMVLISGLAALVLYARLLTNMSTACSRYARDEDRYGDEDEELVDDN